MKLRRCGRATGIPRQTWRGKGDSPDDRLRHFFQETTEEDIWRGLKSDLEGAGSNQTPVLSQVDELQMELLRQVFQESSRHSTRRVFSTESSDHDRERTLTRFKAHNFTLSEVLMDQFGTAQHWDLDLR
jgi:hypothetical protein